MALKDCTLSNGTFIPAGTFISASSRAIHYDDANYDRADVFDGFRFENLNEGKDETKYQAVGTAANFLSFGYGKHSW
jgi:cytochrome P450